MSVQIALFDDRLEITTPGGLPHGMSVDMMRKGHSIARNRALALACKYMRIIESWGSGIPRIDEALVAEGLKPLDIEDNGIDLRLIVWRKTQTTQEMMKEVPTSPKTAQETAQETAVLPRNCTRKYARNRVCGRCLIYEAQGKKRKCAQLQGRAVKAYQVCFIE